ncbi:MAG: anti-sigma factor antagonist [Clostridia bacterium]|nr:anti-sigma factor antagonist [Clostridia bacterium]
MIGYTIDEKQGLTVMIKGEIDHHSAKEIRDNIDNAIELNMPTLLVLDFKDVGFMDSSGIGLVMGRYRNLVKSGAELHITGAPPQIYKILKLAGIEKLARLEER